MMIRFSPRAWWTLILLITLPGCETDSGITSTGAAPIAEISATWFTDLGPDEGWSTGLSQWRYVSQQGQRGQAELQLTALPVPQEGWQLHWKFYPALVDTSCESYLNLMPDDITLWHSFFWKGGSESFPCPFPLPRQALQSPHYPTLLALLQTLTEDFFHQKVTHWPGRPVAVRLVPALSGEVDLAECLLEAMEIWNSRFSQPWFVASDDSSWGVRLVHFPDQNRRPPLAAQITRLDSLGHPLRIHILTGNNYDGLQDRPYAVRGLVHELGHALFLWGHSLDRTHCLWGLAPPLVSAPSTDETKAVRWWHGLPENLDLSCHLAEFPD